MAHWRDYDYVIVSGKLDDDFEQGKSIIIAEKTPHRPATQGQTMAAKRTIILGVTGSIAAFKSADLTSKLKKLGHDVFLRHDQGRDALHHAADVGDALAASGHD